MAKVEVVLLRDHNVSVSDYFTVGTSSDEVPDLSVAVGSDEEPGTLVLIDV